MADIDFTQTELQSFYELYKINYLSTYWYYTSADHQISYDGHTYLPAAIKRGALTKKSELNTQQLDITFPAMDVFLRYVAEAPVFETTITIYLYQAGASVILAYYGKIIKVALSQKNECTVYLDEQNTINTKLPRWLIQPACNHILFDANCGLVKADYKATITVENIEYPNIMSSDFNAYSPTYFEQGIAEFNGDMRWILSGNGSYVNVQMPFRDLHIGDIIYCYPGCKKNPNICRDTFNNLSRYLGSPYVPRKNPVYFGI